MDKPTSLWRWPVLALACIILIGSYYCFDIPAAMKQQIDDYFGNESDYETNFSLLYTLYAAPNVILPFFGGYFVDRFGVRVCLIVFTSLIALGQIIFSFGISIKSWPVIFLGRLVFGFGGECLSVADSALIAEWFIGKELAFAFGINLSIAKLGSVINNLVSPALAESSGVVFASWFGAILCGMSLACVFIVIPIDKYMDKKMIESAAATAANDSDVKASLLINQVSNGQNEADGVANKDIDDEEAAPVSVKDVLKFTIIFWVLSMSCVTVYGAVIPFNNISSSLLLERDYFISPPSDCTLMNPNTCESDQNRPTTSCPGGWYQPPLPVGSEALPLVTPCGTFYGPLTASDIDCSDDCWAQNCTASYCDLLIKAESKASVIMSIPYIISAVLSPFVGLAVDWYGFRAVIAALAAAMIVIVHFLLGYSDVDPVGPLVGQGLAYTGFASVLWPAVPLVVSDRLVGLAFGVVTSLQNLSCAIIPLVVADIYTKSGDKYIPNVELLFACLGLAGFVVGIYMNYYDWRYKTGLNAGAAAAASSDIDDDTTNNNNNSSVEKDRDASVVNPITGYSAVPHHHHHNQQHGHSEGSGVGGRTLSGAGIHSAAAGLAVAHHAREGSFDQQGRLRSRGSSRDQYHSNNRMFSDEKSKAAAIRSLHE